MWLPQTDSEGDVAQLFNHFDIRIGYLTQSLFVEAAALSYTHTHTTLHKSFSLNHPLVCNYETKPSKSPLLGWVDVWKDQPIDC